MAIMNSVAVSTWAFDRDVRSDGPANLHGVQAVSADETWAVGTVVLPETGRTRGLVGRWTRDFRFIEPAGVEPELDVRLLGVDGADDDVWAVGWISDGAGGGRPRIERYPRKLAGLAVEVVPAPAVDRNSALHGVAMLSASEGWAVGGSGPGSGAELTRTLIARWDGSAWSAVPSPSPGTRSNRLDAVAARSADDVWAVGHSTSVGGDNRAEALVLHWDGTSWTQMDAPSPADRHSRLLSVAVTGPDSLWVGGASAVVDSGGTPAKQVALILHWDGSTWRSIVQERTAMTQVSGVVARSEADIWFAGYAKLSGGPENAHIVRWDGRQLRTAVSNPIGQLHVASALSAICAARDNLVAVGWRVVDSTPNQQPAALIGHAGTLA